MAYLDKIDHLAKSLANRPKGTIQRVTVLHDDFCNIWKKPPDECTCNPDFRIITEEPVR